jgi:hypothetical protein
VWSLSKRKGYDYFLLNSVNFNTNISLATDVEGIFRLSGSEKRIKELKSTFNSPDRYGKGLDWTGYTVHDAANILRRYFNQLPEPIIPLEFYDRFRAPLKDHQSQAVGSMDGQSPSFGPFDVAKVIKTYQDLITQLPPLNRQLLLYILDLLAVFASKSDLNKMTTPNLAAIFQPGILSHPAHDMAPEEYKLSQDVLIFLIENQDHFLIGMQGTAADEKTVQEVESGPPTPQHRASTPKHSKSTLVRSGSNSSRYSGVRRSASASSRRSKNSGTIQTSQSPIGSDFQSPLASPPVTGGVHRSNTLPHTRSPNLTPGRFVRDPEANPVTPTAIQESSEAPTEGQARPLSHISTPPEKKMHSQTIMQEIMTPTDTVNMKSLPDAAPPSELAPAQAQDKGVKTPTQTTFSQQPQSQPNQTGTSKIVASLLGKPADGKKPTKLQKKRPGGSANPSAHSSTHSLNDHSEALMHEPLVTPRHENVPGAMWNDSSPLQGPPPIGGGHLHPNMSPAASYASQSDRETTDPETFNLQGDEDAPDARKKRQWFQRDRKAEGLSQPNTTVLGSNGLAQTSRSSVLSGDGSQRKSVTLDRAQGDGPLSDSERESRKEKNPISWIKNKVRDLQDKIDERKEDKRMTSPNRASQVLSPTTGTSSIDTIATAQKSTEQLGPSSGRTSLSKEEAQGKSVEIPRIQEPIPEQPLQEQQAEQKVVPDVEAVSSAAPKQSTELPQPVAQETPATVESSKS